MEKIKGVGGGGGRRWVQLGWGGGMGRKGIQLYLNNNKIFFKKVKIIQLLLKVAHENEYIYCHLTERGN